MTKTNKKVSDKAVDTLVAEVASYTIAKLNLTDEQLLVEVTERFNSVATKSAMLKALRSDNFKVSQDRCYNMYLRYAKAINTDKKA